MASLRDTVREYRDDLQSGIAWLAFWREGRSWHGEAIHLDMSDYLYPEDKMRLSEIQAADPKAVVVNGYYSGYLGDMTYLFVKSSVALNFTRTGTRSTGF